MSSGLQLAGHLLGLHLNGSYEKSEMKRGVLTHFRQVEFSRKYDERTWDGEVLVHGGGIIKGSWPYFNLSVCVWGGGECTP